MIVKNQPSFYLILIFALCLLPSALYGQRPRVGLVLSGGGAAGLAHIGVIKVIEEAGIPIDVVGGTSMGSIVGAMYALGYTPAEMEKMALTQDWESLLTDQIPRTDMTFEYKEELEKYFFSFPVTRGGIQLPTGLVAGQNITNMLAGLLWRAYDIRDFSLLPRPFLCIGADIVTGKEVVLNSGILHDAVRASMAIPTAFTPVEIGGKLMVDGGFINNFPAEHVKAMGADILIGVDVQRELFEKGDLDNMINLLKQVSTLTREDINARNRELCDLLIRPRTPGASTLTFWMAETIIRDGEKTARDHWETLRALGENLKRLADEQILPVRPLEQLDSLFIREISFSGIEDVTPEFVESKMELPFPAWLKPYDIFRAMQRLYGTNEFTTVTYQLEPVAEGVRLVVRAQEKKRELIHVGVHYDNLFNVALLTKGELKNLWRRGDRLTASLTLGENPNLTASYFFITRNNRNYGFKSEFNRIHAYEYGNGLKRSSYRYNDALIDFTLRTTFKEDFSVRAGIQGEFASVLPNVSFLDLDAFNSRMLNLYAAIIKDNFNRSPFPTKGESVYMRLKFVNDFTNNGYVPSLILDYRHRRAFEILPRISFQPAIQMHFAIGDSIAYPYRSYVGGLGYYHKSVIPFVGLDYMQRAANHAIILRADLQWNVKGNHYVIWKTNLGKAFDLLYNLSDKATSLSGTGLTYGYASPIGPVELTLMSSLQTFKPILFINLGYWIR